MHCKDIVFLNPPEPGAILSVKYDYINHKGKLSLNHFNPEYIRIRPDVTWEQLKEQYDKEVEAAK